MNNLSIKEFASKFQAGKFDSVDVKTQCDAGWYDWFCKNTSLAKKTQTLGKKVLQLMNSDKINPDKQYVFFKNNCPMNGPLYDSFSICDLESNDVIYWITPKSGHTGKAEVYGKDNDFKEALVEGSWKDIKNFFL